MLLVFELILPKHHVISYNEAFELDPCSTLDFSNKWPNLDVKMLVSVFASDERAFEKVVVQVVALINSNIDVSLKII